MATEYTGETYRLARKLKAALCHLFLAGLGFSMIIPFLWMLSTALKDKGEVFTYPPRWIPRTNSVLMDGRWVDVRVMQRAPGRLLVRLLSGPRRGEKIEIASDRLTRGRKGAFCTLGTGAKAHRVAVEIVRVITPSRVKVRAVSRGPMKGRVKWCDESDIRRRFRPVWENFVEVWHAIPFGRYYINTIIVATLVTLGQVTTSSLAAYAFARLRFPLRDELFLGYLATMMIPMWVTMIPVFILLRSMPDMMNYLFSPASRWWSADLYFLGRWYIARPIGIDSYFALIVPGCFSAYGTFLLRQFFMGIPSDFEDAAKIDGCSYFGIYCRVILPLSKPALATLTIFTFMGSWQSFIWPLIVTNSRELKVLYVGLASFQGLYTTDWTLLMAASLMALLPVIVVFLLGQRYFIEGIRLGAIEG